MVLLPPAHVYKTDPGDQGCLPFTWKNRKFQLENNMVRIIPYGVLLKLWASGQSDAFLLLLLGFTADVHTFSMLYKLNHFVFMPKISIRVVCVNGKHPNNLITRKIQLPVSRQES